MDEKMKDMLAEAYNYAYAHAIEDVEKNLLFIRDNLKPLLIKESQDYRDGFELLISLLSASLENLANEIKKKNG
jgi:hypothetical protein